MTDGGRGRGAWVEIWQRARKKGKNRKKMHMVPPSGKARDGSRPYHRAKYWAPLSTVGHKTPRKVRACKCHGDHPLPVRRQDTPDPSQGCTLSSLALRCRRQLPHDPSRYEPPRRTLRSCEPGRVLGRDDRSLGRPGHQFLPCPGSP